MGAEFGFFSFVLKKELKNNIDGKKDSRSEEGSARSQELHYGPGRFAVGEAQSAVEGSACFGLLQPADFGLTGKVRQWRIFLESKVNFFFQIKRGRCFNTHAANAQINGSGVIVLVNICRAVRADIRVQGQVVASGQALMTPPVLPDRCRGQGMIMTGFPAS